MIYPTAEDIVLVCLRSLQTTVSPTLRGHAEISAARTMLHLLRLSARRVEKEGQIVFDEIGQLRTLLPDVKKYLSSHPDTDVEVDAIAEALSSSISDPGRYITLGMLAKEVERLRAAVYGAQKRLIALKPILEAHSDYRDLRSRIRTYVGKQLVSEAKLLDPAFVGHGPRR